MEYVDLFTVASASDLIAVGTVVGRSVRVDRVLSGVRVDALALPRGTVVLPAGPDARPGQTGECNLVVVEGERLIAFGRAGVVGPTIHPSYALYGGSMYEHVRVLGAFGAAATDAARAAVLAEEIGHERAFASDAARRLIIDRAMRDAVGDRARHMFRGAGPLSQDAITLAALIGATEIVPRMIESIGDVMLAPLALQGLEQVTNHHVEAAEPSESAAEWSAWWETHAAESHRDWLRAGFAERGVTVDIDDRASLAAVVRSGDLTSRTAGFLRCVELGAVVDLTTPPLVEDAQGWARLAYACSP